MEQFTRWKSRRVGINESYRTYLIKSVKICCSTSNDGCE
nr:MAG TPA: Metallothionein family [Caudoviricetes sp.]